VFFVQRKPRDSPRGSKKAISGKQKNNKNKHRMFLGEGYLSVMANIEGSIGIARKEQ